MAQEPKDWVYASRRTNLLAKGLRRGGMHVYIDSDTLNHALDNACIPLEADLEVKRYALKTKGKIARVLIKIKEVKE